MLHTTRSLCASASLALALATTPLFAATYQGSAYEGFDYTDGLTMDNTYGGGTGWNATGDSGSANTTNWGSASPYNANGSRVITNGGLTSPNVTSPSGTGNAVLVSGSGQIGRTLDQTVDSGTFYFSYLTQKTIAEVRTVNFAFFNGTSERLTIGQIANNVNTRDEDGTWLAGADANLGNLSVLISNAANSPVASPADPTSFNGVYNADAPVAYGVGETILVVGKVEFDVNDSAIDAISIYVNPGDLAIEDNVIPYMYLDHVDIGAITGFRMFAGGNQTGFPASAAQFDEIRFGSTFNSVTGVSAVPEPSTYAALLGLAGFGFAALRRRRA